MLPTRNSKPKRRTIIMFTLITATVVLLFIVLRATRHPTSPALDEACTSCLSETDAFYKLTNEKTIRGRITPLHVVLKCSSFDTRKSPSSLLDRLQAAVRQYGGGDDVPCGPSTEGGSLHPWWALPSSKTNQTRKDDYLLVQAVPSVDSIRRVFRNAQRDTALRYNGAATRRSGFRGEVLYLYVMSAHETTKDALHVQQYVDATTIAADKASLIPDNPPEALYVTPFAVEEALKYMDVLWINDMKDRASEALRVHHTTSYDKETELVQTTKLTIFLLYVQYQFPHVPFVGKGDDDAYFNVPSVIRGLHTMQEEVSDFNADHSNPYYIEHVSWGRMMYLNQIFTKGYFSVLKSSTFSLVIQAANPPLAMENTSFLKTLREVVVLALTPYDNRCLCDYMRYGVLYEDRLLGYITKLVSEYTVKVDKASKADRIRLPYYRNDDFCHSIDWKYSTRHSPARPVPHRRYTTAVHGVTESRVFYSLFLYFSDPSNLFHRTDEDTLRFTQALRWEDDTAYDRIDFTALAQSPLWKELFPPDPAAREAALDASHPWWNAGKIAYYRFALLPMTNNRIVAREDLLAFTRKIGTSPSNAVSIFGTPMQVERPCKFMFGNGWHNRTG